MIAYTYVLRVMVQWLWCYVFLIQMSSTDIGNVHDVQDGIS